MSLLYHPAANVFPLVGDDELTELEADIVENGLLEPIWLHPDGSILDGRDRHRACISAGIEPQFKTWDGKGSAVRFVVSKNVHRRDLTSSQRAAISRQGEAPPQGAGLALGAQGGAGATPARAGC